MSVSINPFHHLKNLHRIVRMYHHLFNDSPIAGHLCCFQIFASINNSAGNILTTIAAATATVNPE